MERILSEAILAGTNCAINFHSASKSLSTYRKYANIGEILGSVVSLSGGATAVLGLVSPMFPSISFQPNVFWCSFGLSVLGTGICFAAHLIEDQLTSERVVSCHYHLKILRDRFKYMKLQTMDLPRIESVVVSAGENRAKLVTIFIRIVRCIALFNISWIAVSAETNTLLYPVNDQMRKLSIGLMLLGLAVDIYAIYRAYYSSHDLARQFWCLANEIQTKTDRLKLLDNA